MVQQSAVINLAGLRHLILFVQFFCFVNVCFVTILDELILVFGRRFGAILQPLKLNYWKRRGRFMLAIAWAASVICSLPQVSDVTWYFII